MRATEFAFSPSTLSLPARGAVVRLTNDGQVPHDFTIPDLGIGTREIQRGETVDLDLDDLKPGTYRVVCAISGHAQAGMVGTLTVRSS